MTSAAIRSSVSVIAVPYYATKNNADDGNNKLLPFLHPQGDQQQQHQCIAGSTAFQTYFYGDPFIGLLKSDRCTRSVCCTRMALWKLQQQQIDDGDEPDIDGILSPFGRRLLKLCNQRDFDIINFWKSYPYHNRPRDHVERLTHLSYTDSDNVIWTFNYCSECRSLWRFVRMPPCCLRPICGSCWVKYIRSSRSHDALAVQVYGLYCLHCYGCSKLVPYREAAACTELDDMNLLRRPDYYPVPKEVSTAIRCPTCLVVAPGLPIELKQMSRTIKGGRPVICSRCYHSYCMACGNCCHNKASCNEMAGGSDLAVKLWANSRNPDIGNNVQNAQRCPVCKTWISLSSDCSARHVLCQCGTELYFCCGQERGIDLLHHEWSCSRYVPFYSCPKLWKSKKQRLAVHIAILILLILFSPILIALSPFIALYCCLYVKHSTSSRVEH